MSCRLGFAEIESFNLFYACRRIACQVGARRQGPAGKANRLRLRESDEPVVKILIAEDDPVCRRVLEAALLKWDYEVTATADQVTGRRAYASWEVGHAVCRALADHASGAGEFAENPYSEAVARG